MGKVKAEEEMGEAGFTYMTQTTTQTTQGASREDHINKNDGGEGENREEVLEESKIHGERK